MDTLAHFVNDLNGLVNTPLMQAAAPGIMAAAFLLAVLPWLPTNWRPVRAILIAVSIALLGRYLWWRYTATLPPSSQPLNFAAGIIFIFIETVALLSAAISLFFLTGVRDRSREADEHRDWVRNEPKPPLVDVLICTYDEEERLLERTILGATGLDYPNFRVWVLDDGKRPWLEKLCATLKCGYITRPDNRHAKAGNINHALGKLTEMPDPPQFVAVLDADFVPGSSFLNRTMCLFHDPTVGIVQTPQHYINPDPIQTNLGLAGVWPDEQRYFFDIVMPAKDAWGAAFCCGTSSVTRVEALTKLGGMPTDSVTEDYLLSLRLKEIGYTTAYLNEPLTFGLAPEGLKEYITQRSRWCLWIHADRARAERPVLDAAKDRPGRSTEPFRNAPELVFHLSLQVRRHPRAGLLSAPRRPRRSGLSPRDAGRLSPVLCVPFGNNLVDLAGAGGADHDRRLSVADQPGGTKVRGSGLAAPTRTEVQRHGEGRRPKCPLHRMAADADIPGPVDPVGRGGAQGLRPYRRRAAYRDRPAGS